MRTPAALVPIRPYVGLGIARESVLRFMRITSLATARSY
jgi:hypothetical protein